MDVLRLLEIIKDPDLKLKISQLYGENLKLKDENHELKKEIDRLKNVKSISSSLIHEDNHYFIKNGQDKDGPFCTKCWDSDNKLVRLHKGFYNYGEQHFECPNCKTHTITGIYNNPDVETVQW